MKIQNKTMIDIFDFSMLGTKEEFKRHQEIKEKKLEDAETEIANEELSEKDELRNR